MNKTTFDITLASLLKYVSRVCHRSTGCTVAESEQSLYDLFKDNPTLSDVVRIMQNNPDYSTASAVCKLSSELAAPKEIYSSANFGEKDNVGQAPLYSVFNRLNTKTDDKIPDSILKYDDIKKSFVRTSAADFAKINYNHKWSKLTKKIRSLSNENAKIEKYLRMIYDYCSDVPLSNDSSLKCDLSLYDYSRLSAAFAAAMAEYLNVNESVGDISAENAFLLYSADFTGIQNFIYTVTDKNVLKTLRAKSFFVELVMENLIDEILDLSGVSRANLLYSGGGHCYVILPNIPECTENLRKLHKQVSLWAAKAFGNSMCVVWDTQECSANDFLNKPEGSYSAVFTKLSSKLANRKLQKYPPDVLLTLNSEIADEKNRECRICGKASSLVRSDDDNRLCEWCSCFIAMSKIIMDENMYFAVLKEKNEHSQVKLFSLNGNSYLAFLNSDKIDEEYSHGNIKRIYCKNHYGKMNKYNESRKIFVCDYQDDKMLEKLADSSDGVKRLGVLRMDVDNLGNTFVSGFKIKDKNTDECCDSRFVSIARTAALSHQLSVFFKQSLTEILAEKKYRINVIYAGGDDVFLVGAWNDVISAAQDIISELGKLSDGKLTASGGIGIYDSKYPTAAYAAETELLESRAKKNEGKSSVTFFEDSEKNTYSWSVFLDKVQNEKLTALRNFLKKAEDNPKGMSFVYKLLEYLRGCDSDKINIARVAYLLGRMCSEKGIVDKAKAKEFSGKIYDWVINATDRQQLITAIYIFVYSERIGTEDDK